MKTRSNDTVDMPSRCTFALFCSRQPYQPSGCGFGTIRPLTMWRRIRRCARSFHHLSWGSASHTRFRRLMGQPVTDGLLQKLCLSSGSGGDGWGSFRFGPLHIKQTPHSNPTASFLTFRVLPQFDRCQLIIVHSLQLDLKVSVIICVRGSGMNWTCRMATNLNT